MAGVSSSEPSSSEIGSGLVARNRSENTSFRREDRSHLKCSQCGGSRHTREGCFKLVGYSEWWDEHKQRKAITKATVSRIGGKANLAMTSPSDSEPPQESATDSLIGNERYNTGRIDGHEESKDP